MIRWVLFDVAGTLLHINGSVAGIYSEVAGHFGIHIERDEISQRFPAAMMRWLETDSDTPTNAIDQVQRWQAVVRDCFPGVEGKPFDGLFEALWETFRRAESWRVDQQAESVIRSLRNLGCRVATASNFDDRLPELLGQFPELEHLEHYFYSASVGWSKPSPRFFQHLESKLETSPNEILIVGDTLENDVLGPKRCGWHSVLFDPSRRHPEFQPRIGSLLELVPFAENS